MDTKLIDQIIKNNPIIPHAGQLALIKRWQESKDKAALDSLVLSNMKIITKEAYKFKKSNGYLSYNDFIQEGIAGLLKAAEMFDPNKEVNFLTYAMWWVKANMRKHVLTHRSIVKLGTTRDDRVLFSNLSKTMSAAEEAGLSGDDKISFVATKLGVAKESVQNMSGSLRGFDSRLDAPVSSSKKGDSDGSIRMDLIPDDRANADISRIFSEEERMKEILSTLVDNMPEEESKILKNRFLRDEPKTLRDVAKEMGISREWVRKLELRAVDRLRKRLASEYGIREY
jgi:RNA polymerase sigma-32 factor